MLAAQNVDCVAIGILLELGADPKIVNNTFQEAGRAVSVVLDRIGCPNGLLCAEELAGLASVPRRCYLALLKVIERNERQTVQLMVTRGMSPLCVDVTGTSISALTLSVNDSLKQNPSLWPQLCYQTG
ncbi:hypothetical protein PoB_006678000 [Plakobranchus ocellatus]|uniref:Uncharacterized protein n=1 Tax=Plakobranchus ocellatus TaxID=259542 RepID=A0AAV4D8H5_9GAST|nr:hypothetical protein PoB_006678000 [Plakobranchus ocellatus]